MRPDRWIDRATDRLLLAIAALCASWPCILFLLALGIVLWAAGVTWPA